MNLIDDARAVIDTIGKPVVVVIDGQESDEDLAVVREYGLGEPPSGWPSAVFRSVAEHAEIRLVDGDYPDLARRDVVRVGSVDYQVRTMSAQAGFMVCRCAADPRARR